MLAKFQSTFEAYWEEGEFEPYAATAEEQARIDHHLARARGDDDASGSAAPVWFNLRPYAYQREMLDALAAERSLHHRWHNLVVAATGTGKTVLAAFDVARLHADFPDRFPSPDPPSLLLIAHRKEILQQALQTFRQVLRDPAFGELYVDGEVPSQWRHGFASVQSLAQRDLAEIPADRFAVVIVDEFHHAAAASYSRWLDHLRSAPPSCSASPPPPNAPTGSTSSTGSTAASRPSCVSGLRSIRACSPPSTPSPWPTPPTSPPWNGGAAATCPPSSAALTPATTAAWI